MPLIDRGRRHFVYMAIARDEKERPLKFGITNNLAERMRQLKRWRGSEVDLLAYLPFKDRRAALEHERELHICARVWLPYRGDWHDRLQVLINDFYKDPGVVLCGGSNG